LEGIQRKAKIKTLQKVVHQPDILENI